SEFLPVSPPEQGAIKALGSLHQEIFVPADTFGTVLAAAAQGFPTGNGGNGAALVACGFKAIADELVRGQWPDRVVHSHNAFAFYRFQAFFDRIKARDPAFDQFMGNPEIVLIAKT